MQNYEFTIFNKLPCHLIHIIINYTDVLVVRNGKYMNRITNNDYRYELLEGIPRPREIFSGITDFIITINLINKKKPECYILTFGLINNANIHVLSVKFCTITEDKYEYKHNHVKTHDNYLFDIDNTWKNQFYNNI